MALPLLPSEGFVRTPAKYPHDAFAADTGGRVRPHSGLDSTPTVANARNIACRSGKVVAAGYTSAAGNYVAIQEAPGRIWVTFHQRENFVGPGQDVTEGQAIGYTGNTGGTGAIGSAKIGVHNHTSIAKDMEAVRRLISGNVRARYKGETNQQWADAMGLIDPWPFLRDGGKDSNDGGTTTPTTPEPPKEYEMTQAETDLILGALARLETNVYGLGQRVARIEADGAINKWALTDPTAGVRKMVADVQVGISQLPQTNITPANLSLDQKTIDTIAKTTAKATNDDAAARLRD